MKQIKLTKNHSISLLSYCTSWDNYCECCNTKSDKSVESKVHKSDETHIFENGEHLNLCHICMMALMFCDELPCEYIHGSNTKDLNNKKVKDLLITLIRSIRRL